MRPFELDPARRVPVIVALVAASFFAGIGARLVCAALWRFWG